MIHELRTSCIDDLFHLIWGLHSDFAQNIENIIVRIYNEWSNNIFLINASLKIPLGVLGFWGFGGFGVSQ